MTPKVGLSAVRTTSVQPLETKSTLDFAILLLLWLSFASLTTLHVALAFVIGQRLGKLHGWLALLAFPVAPYFAYLARAKSRSFAWCLLFLSYSILLFFATR